MTIVLKISHLRVLLMTSEVSLAAQTTSIPASTVLVAEVLASLVKIGGKEGV